MREDFVRLWDWLDKAPFEVILIFIILVVMIVISSIGIIVSYITVRNLKDR